MESSMGSSATTRNSRLRPFHTCGVSILTIAHKVYTKAEQLQGPIGSITKTLATLTSPIVSTIEHQWLAILSFADDKILTVENVVETLFPPSAYVFDKIDMLVQISETLPGKLDHVANAFPVMIRKVPYLNSASMRLTYGLKCLISILTVWESNSAVEKEIVIDIGCDTNVPNESSSSEKEKPQIPNVEDDNEVYPTESKTTDATEKDNSDEFQTGNDLKTVKFTYKEALEKGKKEKIEEEEEEEIKKDSPGVVNEDPILDLFESSWNMKPGRAI